ncbi:hypothetical protein [Stygiolobus caldivivus]|uniref:Uncharacterized protein n=1 Tax=Stygiolobus caldivivus TaxID=2824673 RepID=A0A8D5U802_9CREN|nr:hypothetical protein [Stygiolobus caldivivus]BCU71291.1 hypothetical protein KN1_25880 [Stygiolobus caldivivus]
MNIKLAYSRDDEIKPLEPLLRHEIDNRGFKIELIKVNKEDELKFIVDKVDLVYLPLPVFNFISNLRVISNGSYITSKLKMRILSTPVRRVLVPGSNSTEFYLVKILYNNNVTPVLNGSFDAEITYDDEGEIDLLSLWNQQCNNSPLILKVLSSKNLDESVLLELKVLIRESASRMVEKKEVSTFSKELGLKGRNSMECFFNLCTQKNLCSNVSYYLI